MDDEEPPSKMKKPMIEPTSNPPLPDDLLVSCLARVSRLYYPTLSSVSKRFCSLLTSPELYQARSLLGRTENCLYVCLGFSPTDHNPHWFMLCRRPNQTLKKKNNKSSEYVLSTIPIPHSPPVNSSGLVAVGSNIYSVGGSYNSLSSDVSFLDCWSHTWCNAPSMNVEREYPSANFLDGKIYVTGGCYKYYKVYNPSNWMEVFDLKTQTWEPMSCPIGGPRRHTYHDKTDHDNVVVDGKLYMCGDKSMAYNPKDGIWSGLTSEMDLGFRWYSSCVIGNVLYYYYYDEGFKWYDTKVRSWKTLNGIKGLPKFSRFANVRLADYGGKMALFWDKFVNPGGGLGYKNRMIWCAMIALERRNNDEICGKVEWSGAVLPRPIPIDYEFVYVAAVTV